jgi:hypothetical protein
MSSLHGKLGLALVLRENAFRILADGFQPIVPQAETTGPDARAMCRAMAKEGAFC